MLKNSVCSLLVVVLVLFGLQAQAENGVTADKITIGQSCALKGLASSLGQGMATGLKVYFDNVNAQGGINGRQIQLVSKDDGYEPTQAIRTTADLLNTDKVFLLIGEVGTPTSKAVLPLIEREQVPFLAPFTGAELLRTPVNKWVINMRGSYNQEMEKLANYLVDQQGIKRIACFYQDDAYGQAGLSGIELALKNRGMNLVGTGKYERNTLAIQEGLAAIKAVKPEAVIMVGAYTPCAAFIKSAKSTSELENAVFCNISFVGTKALREALGDAAEGCIVSEVVPNPWNQAMPLTQEFNAMMKKAGLDDQIDFTSLEGFMAAKFFCQVLAKMEGEPTREGFIETVHKVGKFDLGGVTLNYGPDDHQGMDDVFVVQFRGNEYELASK